jgi:aldehyde dehydrogenase
MYHEAIEKVSKQVLIRDRYDNFIGGKWVAPSEGRYFDNPSPVTGKKLCAVPRSTAADIELALDAAHKAKDAWGKTSVAKRAHPEQDRGQAGIQSRSARFGRDARQRQADP